MKGASKVIMGATLVMVASLAIVLGLIFVLLAELYCSLLLRRRKLKNKSTTDLTTLPLPTTTTVADVISSSENQTFNNSTSPLTSFYSHGVLRAPRNLLFPLVPCKETKFELHPSFYAQNSKSSTIRFVSSPEITASTSSVSISSVPEVTIKIDTCSSGTPDFLYISNPIYDNQATNADTPFETPDSSPSRLEDGCSCSCSDDGDGDEICEDEVKIDPSSVCSPLTPPLTPMKKLPAQACSVPLRDASSLGASSNDNDTNSNVGLSSSASCSATTSPSW